MRRYKYLPLYLCGAAVLLYTVYLAVFCWDMEDLPEGCKIEDGRVVLKTLDDTLNDGDISLQEYNEEIDRRREYRYQAETDKMGLMYLRGECSLEEWKAAMDKIRQELPKK